MSGLCAVVVLYQSNVDDVIENIDSYIHEVDKLYIVDNSETIDEQFVKLFSDTKKYFYIASGDNKGIAYALNIACEHAIEDGFNWILTMDQDSRVSPGMIEQLSRYRDEHVGIISPYHADQYFPKSQVSSTEEVLTVPTSGNLLNLQVYQTIGRFKEELFIDYVDIEYCLRIHSHGFKTLQVNSAILDHKLGNISKHHVFGKYVLTSNHNYTRRYYNARNRFTVYRQYPQYDTYIRNNKKEFIKEVVKIVLFEKDTIRKLYYIARGLLDYKRHKLGKLDV